MEKENIKTFMAKNIVRGVIIDFARKSDGSEGNVFAKDELFTCPETFLKKKGDQDVEIDSREWLKINFGNEIVFTDDIVSKKDMTAEIAVALAAQKEDYEAQISNLNSAHQDEIAKLKEDYEAQIAALNNDLEELSK